MNIQQQFKIRINYKSGIQEECWVSSFTIEGGRYSWCPVTHTMKPILMGTENIESVYQVGVRKRIVF